MPLYGTQVTNIPGHAIGYGPAGGIFDPSNPVVSTSSGIRPLGDVIGFRNQQQKDAQRQALMANPGSGRPVGSEVYKRPAGMTPGQHTYATTGGAAGTPPPNAGGGGIMGNYSTGITAGTIPNSAISGGMANFGFNSVPGVMATPQAQSAISQQYSDAMNQGLGTAGLDFARNAAFQQAQMALAQQRARSDAGIGFGNLLARLYEAQLGGQTAEDSIIQNALMGLVG